MAKDRRKLQHIHSSIPDRQPTPQTLEVGEIAVNNADKKEFLSIKSSQDKVVRFSSDEQMITWMEKKEVVPYVGQVRGDTYTATTADTHGSVGITNDDLLQNKSNIVVKMNQVAAANTPEYDKINGATDIYGHYVNLDVDGTVQGAGFSIDMSRYAMIGANPSFSSLTVTDKTDLSGNTTITDGDGTGTRSGKTLTIKMTNENETITTLNESATTRTTKIGTENLNVSGTTTEVHNQKVTITNNANVEENTSGTTTITRDGNVSYRNLHDVSETTDGTLTELVNTNNYRDVNGDYTGTTGGTTTEVKTGKVTETNSDETEITRVKKVTETDKANRTLNISGTSTTNVGTDVVENTTGTTTIDRHDDVSVNNRADVTEVTSGDSNVTISGTSKVQVSGSTTADTGGNVTVKTSGDTSINRQGAVTENNQNNVTLTTSGTTSETKKGAVTETNFNDKTETTVGNNYENVSGRTVINHSGTTNYNYTGATTLSGSSLVSTTTGNTTIEANGEDSDVTIQSTGASGDVNVFANDVLTATADTIVVSGTTSISAKTPTTYVSGSTLEVKESNINLSAATGTDISGGTFTSTSTGNTTLNASGNTAINTSGNTTVTSTGNTTIQSTASGSGVNIYAGSAGTATVTGNTIAITGTTESTVKAPTNTVSGTTTNIYGATTLTMTGATVNTTGGTVNISGGTGGVNITGTTKFASETTINNNLNVTGNTKITGTTDISGATNIDDDLTVTGKANVSGATTIDGATTINNNLTVTGTTDISGATRIDNNLTVSGASYLSGDTEIGGTLKVTGCISGNCVSAGTITAATSANISSITAITGVTAKTVSAETLTLATSASIPTISATTISAGTIHTSGLEGVLSWSYGDTSGKEGGSYNGSESSAITIPSSLSHITSAHTHSYAGSSTAGGAATSANKLNTDGGSATNPVYFTGGVPAACTYSLNKTVPADAVFTDHYAWSDITGKPDSYTPSTHTHSISDVTNLQSTLNGKSNTDHTHSTYVLKAGDTMTGNLTAPAFYASSDERLKENIENVSYSKVANAASLSIKSFNFKTDETKKTVIGVIAQEVEKANLEFAVVTGEDGMKAVDYTSICLLKIAYLEEKIKELDSIIKELKDNKQ